MNQLHQVLLHPTDVLFFRDGRPMGGSLAGHTAAWPLPDITNHALHAALHRSGLEGVHEHRRGRGGEYGSLRDRKFGSLLTAGPFPVNINGFWFFPRPIDAQSKGNLTVTLRPFCPLIQGGTKAPCVCSSLPMPLEYAVANTQPPSKDAAGEPWVSSTAYHAYLREQPHNGPDHFRRDGDFVDTEHKIGIAIDPTTSTTGQGEASGKIYSAHYLRLREGVRLGLFAEAMDKVEGEASQKHDLILDLLGGEPKSIIVGGQQRLCTAARSHADGPLPLPKGMSDGFNRVAIDGNPRWLVKWVLLSPAIWPEISPRKRDGSLQNPHPGGWLPNWVFLAWDAEKREAIPHDHNGEVRLTAGFGVRKARRKGGSAGSTIPARLVAAIVPQSIPVTGWAFADPDAQSETPSGAKSTHFAVPAGAVYYFEVEPDSSGGPGHAIALAAALNWHGAVTSDAATDFRAVKHRRSTLMGEKGFGLGVCGTWTFWGTSPDVPRSDFPPRTP